MSNVLLKLSSLTFLKYLGKDNSVLSVAYLRSEEPTIDSEPRKKFQLMISSDTANHP